MTVQLDAVGGTASRLTTDGISAGPAASFSPLPPEILAFVPPPPPEVAASQDYTAPPQALRAEALALAINPYAAYALGADGANGSAAAAPVAPGIARLRLSDVMGEEVKVANLSAAVTFTVPSQLAQQRASGLLPSCVFWDPERQRFSGDGCAALPAPRPPGWRLRWLPGYAANSTRELSARGWSAEPVQLQQGSDAPPTASAGLCTVVFVDCARHPRGARVHMFPANPFAAPPVICADPPGWIAPPPSPPPPPPLPPSGPYRNATASSAPSNLTLPPPVWSIASNASASSASATSSDGAAAASSFPRPQAPPAPPPFPQPPPPPPPPPRLLGPILRAFVGCEIARRNNSIGCWWDVATQAFDGPGCVFDDVEQCACLHLTGAPSSLSGDDRKPVSTCRCRV